MSIVFKSVDNEILDCKIEEENFRITHEESGENYNSSSMEMEKRARREIANSNERRRMQSINAGFQSLKNLLPHHEGEKLSKAAILQQTAEYVYALEQERTQLLSQNCHLKRLLDQSDSPSNGEIQISKKRKFDNVMTMQTISDSSDEGLGSMSPEPVTIFTVLKQGQQPNQTSGKEFLELKHQLDIERRNRVRLEEKIRQMECQLYPDQIGDVTIQYQHQEVIEHTDNIREVPSGVSNIKELYTKVPINEIHHHPDIQDCEMVVETIPTVGQTQVVVCSPVIVDDERPMTPCQDDIIEEDEEDESAKENSDNAIEQAPTARLQPILEAAIKAEPKVEVERINSPVAITATIVKEEEGTNSSAPSSRMYVTSTSRQNLETIVEAIRHLEGDPLFGEITEPTQDAPLALTTNKPAQSKLQVEMNSFLQFRSSNSNSTASHQITPTNHIIAHNVQQQQQCRPGVIVGKQNS